MIVLLTFFFCLFMVGSAWVYSIVTTVTPAEELPAHKTKMLEKDNFPDWPEEWYTVCECVGCTRTKELAIARAKRQAREDAMLKRQVEIDKQYKEKQARERLGHKDGYNFYYPEGVPLNAHVEVVKNGWQYNDLCPLQFTWTDEETGKQMGIRITGTRDPSVHVFADEFFEPVKTISQASSHAPLILTPNERRAQAGYIDYDRAVDEWREQIEHQKREFVKQYTLPNPVVKTRR